MTLYLRTLVFCVVIIVGGLPTTAESRPNILIITADNLGYGDLRCYNDESPIKTPALDRLAKEGVRLTSFYTVEAICKRG